MSTEIGTACETERPHGAIKEILAGLDNRIDVARNISRRLQDLRVRLVGDKTPDCVDEKGGTKPPEPVRAEIVELDHSLEILRDILVEVQDNLTSLEQL